MTLEEKALKYTREMEKLYFEDHDIKRALEKCSSEGMYFGTGEADNFLNRTELKEYMEMQEAGVRACFRRMKSRYRTVSVSHSVCMVCGILELREMRQEEAGKFKVRVTALWKETKDSLEIKHLHLSIPGARQENMEFYSKSSSPETACMLRQMVEEKSAEIEARDRDIRTLTENIPGGIFRCRYDKQLTILQMNDGFLSLFGYGEEEIKTRFDNSFWNMIDVRDRQAALAEAERQIAVGNAKELEYRVRCKDGGTIWVLDKGQLIKDQDGAESFYCILVDITARKRAQEELHLSLERHQIIMDQTNDIIFEWDIQKDTFSFSSNWEKKFGYHPVTEKVSENLLKKAHIYPEDLPKFMGLLHEIKNGKHYLEAEIRLEQSENRFVWCRARVTAQHDEAGRLIKAVGVLIDIDDEMVKAQGLIEKAQRDTLTKLYNKGTAQKLIEEYLDQKPFDSICALFIVDIDDFKMVNDSMGHLFGDAFLIEIAHELQNQFRADDIVGRIGGDEFIVCIKNIPGVEVAKQRAAAVIKAFECMATEEKRSCAVSCSIGITMVPEHGSSFHELYRKADYALYHAKMKGKDRYMVYDEKTMFQLINGLPKRLYSAVSEKIDSDITEQTVNDKLVEYVFRILYKSIDIEGAVDSILEIVGRQYDVSRAYIFENSEDDSFCSNTFEWCNDGVQPQLENLQHVSYQGDLDGDYLENFNEEGIFYCRDIADLAPKQYRILEPQGIKSMLQCAIRDNGKIKGYVGFDECRTNRLWTQDQIDALTFISEVLSTFLLKKRAQDRAEQSASAMETILDNQNSWIYVIRPDTYELLYVNRKTKELVPSSHVGMPCYAAYFNLDTPCQQCPAQKLKRGVRNFTMEKYNPLLEVWSSADASVISWKGERAILLACHDITKFKNESV